LRIASQQRSSMFSSDRTVKAEKPGIAMFTTEYTEFTERKQHKVSCDSSVCSVDSVVKYVTRTINANAQGNLPVMNDELQSTREYFEPPPTAGQVDRFVRQSRQSRPR
jgi:hypothetical protein